MKSSRTRKGRRPVLDIDFRKESKILARWFLNLGGQVVNLKPTLLKKYKWRVVLGVFALVLLLFAINKVFTRAEVKDFYPQTCLGTWQSPGNSQGEPENFNLASSSFSENNSAVFLSGQDKIFCGKFLADDYEAEGNIKNVGLTLVWNIEGVVASQQAAGDGEMKTSVATSSESSSTKSDSGGVNGDTQKESFLFDYFIGRVRAEELSSTLPILDQVPVSEATNQDTSAGNQKPADEVSTSSTINPGEVVPEVANSSSSQSVEESTTTAVVAPPPPPDNNFLKISYSLDGQNWFELSRVSGDNWKNFTINLPNVTWEDLRHFQVSVEGVPTALQKLPKVFLDGMFLEIQYDLPPIINLNPTPNDNPALDKPEVEKDKQLPVINLPSDKRPVPADSQSEDFTPGDSPRFDFDLNNLPDSTSSSPGIQSPSPPTSLINGRGKTVLVHNGGGDDKAPKKNSEKFLLSFLNFFGLGGKAEAQEALAIGDQVVSAQNPIVAQVVDPLNHNTDIQPLFLTVNNNLRISIPEPEREFKPGRYRLKLWVYKNGAVYFTENNFTWGVLAINFNKSIFTFGDNARMGVAVLDDMGHTICGAEVGLKVTDPKGNFYVFSTRDGSVARSETCGPQSVTNEPDYLAELKVREAGTYKVSVTARTKNGVRQITDQFEVQKMPIFDVERDGPTRIYPPSNYKVSLKVTANQDFKGQVTESVPVSFKLITEKISTEDVFGNVRMVHWNLDLKKGESQDLVYFFKAPEISPELYKLGPLSFNSESSAGAGSLVFEEARQWQVAADAAGDVIVLWDGATIPNGWTCLSCVATDIFFGVFPRASSTPGTASTSVNTSAHTLTFSSASGGSTSASISTTGSSDVDVTDAHDGWGNGALGASDITPLYWGLKFISANTTTLPNGAIAIFDVASSSLPANWIYASTTENYYLYGTSTVGTGGAATHTHNTSGTITSANVLSVAGGTVSGFKDQIVSAGTHTHTIPNGTVTTSTDNNTPPYIGVVFGKLTTTSTLTVNMIAMFDNANLPANWSSVSTSGSAYAGRLLYGTSTFGGTGGASTHNHGGSIVITSASSSDTVLRSTGSNLVARGTHTHNVTFTIGSGNSLPIYRDVVLAKYTGLSPTGLSGVVLNLNSAIVLIPNSSTTISVAASTTGSNLSYATGTISRSGVGYTCTADNLNCYQIPSSSCSFSGASSSTVSCSANIYYFAQATDASSSFASQNWGGQISLTDTTPTSVTSGTAAGVELNTLLAINLTTSSVNYGTMSPTSTTGLVNQVVLAQNAGNSSSSIQVSGTALVMGSNSIATSSQHYASSTFTFGGNEGVLSDTATTISGITLLPNVSLVNDISTWTTTTALATSTERFASVDWNGYIYNLGGETSGGTPTSGVSYASTTLSGTANAWLQGTSLPNTIFDEAAAVNVHSNYTQATNYIYLSGGVAITITTRTSTVYYAPISATGSIGSWSTGTSMPTAYIDHASVAYNDYLYIIGGSAGLSGTVMTSTVRYVSISSSTGAMGSWLETQALPAGLTDHTAVVNKGFVYVMGGFTEAIQTTTTVYYAQINSNGTIGSWITTSPLPAARYQHASAVIGDYLYVVGGSSASTVYYAKINSDGSVGTWATGTALPTTRKWLGSAAFNGYLYTIGGETPSNVVTSSVIFTPITNGLSQHDTFWGLGITDFAPTGTYSGVNTFSASYVQ